MKNSFIVIIAICLLLCMTALCLLACDEMGIRQNDSDLTPSDGDGSGASNDPSGGGSGEGSGNGSGGGSNGSAGGNVLTLSASAATGSGPLAFSWKGGESAEALSAEIGLADLEVMIPESLTIGETTSEVAFKNAMVHMENGQIVFNAPVAATPAVFSSGNVSAFTIRNTSAGWINLTLRADFSVTAANESMLRALRLGVFAEYRDECRLCDVLAMSSAEEGATYGEVAEGGNPNDLFFASTEEQMSLGDLCEGEERELTILLWLDGNEYDDLSTKEAATVSLLFTAVGYGDSQGEDVTPEKTAQPDFELSYTASELAMIEAATGATATEQQIKEAISMIYNKANDNKINHTDSAVAVLRGEGSATFDVMGVKPSETMIVRGMKVQSGKEFYYQKAAPIIECSIPALQSTLEKMLNQQERVYTDGVSEYYGTGILKGKNATVEDVDDFDALTIPFVLMKLPDTVNKYSGQEEFCEKGFYLQDPREITNFKVTPNAIVLNPLAEGQQYIELVTMEDGAKYYLCRFSLDINNEDCIKVARDYLRKSAESDDLEYLRFDVQMEVWENGYLKKMHDDEQWTGSAAVGSMMSASWYETIVYYEYEETLIEASERAYYLGDDEGASWAGSMIRKYKEELKSIENGGSQGGSQGADAAQTVALLATVESEDMPLSLSWKGGESEAVLRAGIGTSELDVMVPESLSIGETTSAVSFKTAMVHPEDGQSVFNAPAAATPAVFSSGSASSFTIRNTAEGRVSLTLCADFSVTAANESMLRALRLGVFAESEGEYVLCGVLAAQSDVSSYGVVVEGGSPFDLSVAPTLAEISLGVLSAGEERELMILLWLEGSEYGDNSTKAAAAIVLIFGAVEESEEIPPVQDDEEESDVTFVRVDGSGEETEEGEYILFGSYPQSEVTDENITAALTAAAGTLPTRSDSQRWTSYGYRVDDMTRSYMWYIDLSYSGEKYRGVYFNAYRPKEPTQSSSAANSYQDENGYEPENVYWFKYEPLKWKILAEEDGEALIFCESVIDGREYNSSKKGSAFYHNGDTGFANNYALSDIRVWLNDTFYNTAFNDLQKELILLTTVDNSARSTNPNDNATTWNYGNNQYACANTEDYVFLPSAQEITNSAYGYNSDYNEFDSARRKKTTAYAKAQGTFTSATANFGGNGKYWLRSPYYQTNYCTCFVDASGGYYSGVYVNYTYYGVAPALRIKIA